MRGTGLGHSAHILREKTCHNFTARNDLISRKYLSSTNGHNFCALHLNKHCMYIIVYKHNIPYPNILRSHHQPRFCRLGPALVDVVSTDETETDRRGCQISG